MDHSSMLTLIVLASYFMIASYVFDDVMNLIFLFSIPKCNYPCSIIENLFREPMIQVDHLAKPR